VPYQYSSDFVNSIKEWENAKLFHNKIPVSKKHWDPIGRKNQVGYGFTDDAVATAIRFKKLPKGYKLPSKMTEKEADAFLRNKILPAFEDLVKTFVQVPLTRNQLNALVSFAYNLGTKPLLQLIGYNGYSTPQHPHRLNTGNYESVPKIIMLYNKGQVNGKKIVLRGLDKRRIKEAEWFVDD
jgi:lysozyme